MESDVRFGPVEVIIISETTTEAFLVLKIIDISRFQKVVCEGYSSPNDKYVLRGSCGLEYHLDLTSSGRQRDSARYENGK